VIAWRTSRGRILNQQLLGRQREYFAQVTRAREEAVQGAGMVESFQAQGAAESDASVRLAVRSHVPGTRRDRAQADEAGNKKAKL
jgi:hypothetical protein